MKSVLISIFSLNLITASMLTNANSKYSVALEAHVHGLSEMTIAIDDHTIEIEFSSPAMNIVGFEYQAKSKQDIAKVENAVSLLKNHKSMIALSGGQCVLEEVEIDTSSLLESNDQDHGDHGDHADHADHHADEEHYTHSEVTAHYHYHCESTKSLSTITVNAFSTFSGIEKIRALWVTEQQQGAAVLSAKSNKVNVK